MSESHKHMFAAPIAIDNNYFDHLLVMIANLGIPQSCNGMGAKLRPLAEDLDAIAEQRAFWGTFRDRRPELYRPLLTLDGTHPHAALLP